MVLFSDELKAMSNELKSSFNREGHEEKHIKLRAM